MVYRCDCKSVCLFAYLISASPRGKRSRPVVTPDDGGQGITEADSHVGVPSQSRLGPRTPTMSPILPQYTETPGANERTRLLARQVDASTGPYSSTAAARVATPASSDMDVRTGPSIYVIPAGLSRFTLQLEDASGSYISGRAIGRRGATRKVGLALSRSGTTPRRARELPRCHVLRPRLTSVRPHPSFHAPTGDARRPSARLPPARLPRRIDRRVSGFGRPAGRLLGPDRSQLAGRQRHTLGGDHCPDQAGPDTRVRAFER